MTKNYHSNFQKVKENVSMQDAIKHFGFSTNRAGFISCPFHKEKTASLKIYEKSFHCFGCGTGGDVINFVAKHLSLPNREACEYLMTNFGLTSQPMTLRQKMAIAKHRQEQGEKKKLEIWVNYAYGVVTEYYKLLTTALHKGNINDWQFIEATREIATMRYFIEALQDDPKGFYKVNRLWVIQIEARIARWNNENGQV